IGRDGQFYLFEVNNGPSTSAVIAEVAYLRSNYYRYILRTRLDTPVNNRVKYEDYEAALKEKDNNRKKAEKVKKENEYYKKQYKENYKKKNEAVKNDNDYYKKQYEAVKKSTSWKVSKPIRKAGSIMKKFRSKDRI